MNMAEIKMFFKEYAQAYLAFNADTLMKFFNYPSLVHDLTGIHLLQNENDLKIYEKSFLENLKQRKTKIIETDILEYDLEEQLPTAISCKVAYKLFDASNQLIMDFDYSYSLFKNEIWKILFARLGTVRKY